MEGKKVKIEAFYMKAAWFKTDREEIETKNGLTVRTEINWCDKLENRKRSNQVKETER